MDDNTTDYSKKYVKYKNKYEHLRQIAGARNVAQQYNDKIKQLMKKMREQNISLQLVIEINDFFKEFVTKNYDPENMHILEDTLMSRFISDVAEKKITNSSEIQNIAFIIKKLNDENYLKWYS